MDVNAFGLAAGRKHAKARRPLPNAFLARNVNPRKSSDWFGKVAAPVRILAVDDLRLLRMQHQLAGRKAILQRAPWRSRVVGALAVTYGLVRVAFEWDVRIRLKTTGCSSRQRSTVIARGHSMARSARAFRRLEKHASARFSRWAKVGVWDRVFQHLTADADK
jgi:hypothetical protein